MLSPSSLKSSLLILPQGTRILAASYDKSALFWKLDDCVPKVTEHSFSRSVYFFPFLSFAHPLIICDILNSPSPQDIGEHVRHHLMGGGGVPLNKGHRHPPHTHTHTHTDSLTWHRVLGREDRERPRKNGFNDPLSHPIHSQNAIYNST